VDDWRRDFLGILDMGSYCSLKFDDLEILSSKSVVPDNLIALFQEADRVVRKVAFDEGEPPEADIVYEAPRETVLMRLSLLGFTEASVRAKFSDWLDEERVRWNEYLAEGRVWAADTARAISGFDYEVWRERAPEVLRSQLDGDQPKDEIDRQMRDEEGWLHFDGLGSLASLRAMLEALPDVTKVTLNISDLVFSGYIDENAPICARRREEESAEPRSLAPTVILAEGSSDIRILEQSLKALYPEMQDYFSFFDHVELNVDGGASYLVKFLKAFAAARAPIRVAALFDNDTAGLQAYRQAVTLGLPRNIIVLRLPDIALASNYPTIGPQGKHLSDVNKRAASIELYLGISALTASNGGLRPVRWSAYVPSADAYQGEVESKGKVQAKFLRELGQLESVEAARDAYPELVAVWGEIFRSVEITMVEARRSEHRLFVTG